MRARHEDFHHALQAPTILSHGDLFSEAWLTAERPHGIFVINLSGCDNVLSLLSGTCDTKRIRPIVFYAKVGMTYLPKLKKINMTFKKRKVLTRQNAGLKMDDVLAQQLSTLLSNGRSIIKWTFDTEGNRPSIFNLRNTAGLMRLCP